MVIKSQMNKRGAVIAKLTDSSMLNYDRDAYAYCWPRRRQRTMTLIRMGYTEEPYGF